MSLGSALRWSGALLCSVAPAMAVAQQWTTYAGAASRVEATDNYYLTAPGPGVDEESAFTLSVTPFFAAARRTEVSELVILTAVGANKVWGLPTSEDFISGRLSVDGSLREERSTWTGSAAYTRSSQLQNFVRGDELVTARALTDAATMAGRYTYALAERWTIGATAGAYANRYDSFEGTDEQTDDHGFNAGGELRYLYSDQTQLTSELGYFYYSGDRSRSDVVSMTVGVVHRYSPQLTLSASGGGYWRDTTQSAGTSAASGTDTGGFLGVGITYAVTDLTRLDASFSQGQVPSGVGELGDTDSAFLALSHRFSDRLTGRIGASYARTSFTVTEGTQRDTTMQGEMGLSYRLGERWTLEAGYQYTRTRNSQRDSEPSSNLVFASIGYNWPGASLTGWVGRPADTTGAPGAGPLTFTEGASILPAAPSTTSTTPTPATTPTSPEPTPFDPLTLP